MWPRARNALAASAGTAVLAPEPCGQEPSGFWFFPGHAKAVATAGSTFAGTFSSSSAARTTVGAPGWPSGSGAITAKTPAVTASERAKDRRRKGMQSFMGNHITGSIWECYPVHRMSNHHARSNHTHLAITAVRQKEEGMA